MTIDRFWAIALPVMAIVVPVFFWGDLNRAAHNIEKEMRAREVKRVSTNTAFTSKLVAYACL